MRFLLLLQLSLLTSILFAQDYYDVARAHFLEDQLDSARYYLDLVLKKGATAEDYFLSGMIHEQENKDLRALADYEAVVKMDPANLEAHFHKGLIYYNSASSDQAIEDFTYVLENQSRSHTNAIYYGYDPFGKKGTFITTLQSMVGRVYQYRGLAYQKNGETKKALRDFNTSFEYDSIADFFVNRALLYSNTAQDDLAIRDLRSAIAMEPDHYVAWYNLALLDEKAQLPLELLRDDQFAPMLNLLGANSYENGEYTLALKYLTKAIEHNGKDELAFLNRGKSLLKLGSFRQARADFLKAIQINSSNTEAFYLVGNSFFYEGNFENAIGFYERYLVVDQGHKNVWYNAAMAYLSVENKERGCDCLKRSDRLGMDQAVAMLEKHCESQ